MNDYLPTIDVPRTGACALAIAALLTATGASAVPLQIDNAGFEEQVHGPNTFTFGAPTGWTAYNTGAVVGDSIGTLNPSTTSYFLPGQYGGANVAIAYMRGNGTANVEFGISQTLQALLAADTTYTLAVEIGNIASGTSDLGNGPIDFDLDGFSGYRVDLLAGGTVLASDNNTLASGGNAIPEGEFRTSQVVFDSTGVDALLIGVPLEIRLVNLNVPDPIDLAADREVDFDDVTLDASPSRVATAPEPTTLLLLAAGAVAAVGSRRRIRSTA